MLFKKKKKEKKETNPLPLGSWWDIYALPSVYQTGKSAPPGWHEQKCLRDEPEEASSIRLYICVSHPFTQTLRGVKTLDHHEHSSHSLVNNWLGISADYLCVIMCVFAVCPQCQLLVLCPVLQCDLPLRLPHTLSLSHINVLHCLSFFNQANWPMRSQSK